MTDEAAATAPSTEETVASVKGFEQDFTCRGFKYEVGQTYTHDGPVEACVSGFHACEHPLDVLGYYPPATSRYALVTQSGTLARHGDDTKIASAKITIEAELRLPDLIDRAVRWVFDRAKPEGRKSHATGDSGAASATGDSGAASATGYRGAASATGKYAVALAAGLDGRAMAAEGCALFLVNRDPGGWAIRHAWAGIAGRDGIKPLTWYSLDEGGKPVECAS